MSFKPYSMIKVPSKGAYYQNKKDFFLVRFLSYADEYILTDELIMESGEGLIQVLNNVIVDDFDVKKLVPGDVQAIALFLRSSGFGDKIDLNITCPNCKTEQEKSVRLSSLQMKEVEVMPSKGLAFDLELPHSKKPIIIKMPTFLQEIEAKRRGKEGFVEKLKQIIISIDGNDDERFIQSVVPNMSMKDARFLREFLNKNTPGVDTSTKHICNSCRHEFEQQFSTDYNFLKLPPSYRENMLEQLFSISYYSKGAISWNEAMNMTTHERNWAMRRIEKALKDEKKAAEKTQKGKGFKR